MKGLEFYSKCARTTFSTQSYFKLEPVITYRALGTPRERKIDIEFAKMPSGFVRLDSGGKNYLLPSLLLRATHRSFHQNYTARSVVLAPQDLVARTRRGREVLRP